MDRIQGEKLNILAIDPGTSESAYVVIDSETYKPIEFFIIKNKHLVSDLNLINLHDIKHTTIEMIASYGMAVGKEVFETCVWIGEFKRESESLNIPVSLMYRKDVKLNLCGNVRAKDANIAKALIDRFAMFDLKYGKGNKNKQDWFYGFKADIWQSYALGVSFIDLYLKEKHDE